MSRQTSLPAWLPTLSRRGAIAPSAARRPVPLRLKMYIAVVAGGFTAGLVAALAVAPPVMTPAGVETMLGVALLVAVARAFPVHLAPKRKLIVDTAPSFAAAVLLPPPLAAAAAAVGMLGGEVRSRGRWFQAIFNASVSGARVGAAALVCRLITGTPLRSAQPAVVVGAALFLGAAVLYLVNSLLVDAAAGLTLGQNPFRGWWAAQARKLPYEAVLVLLGLFAALPARDEPWLLPLLLVPAAVVRHSLHDGLREASETRDALESLAEAVDLRHQRAADHSRRVAELARVIARRLALPSREVELIADAARLRDIGEIALAPDLLARAGSLTEEERAEVWRHAATGAQMIERFPDFAACAPLIRHHHERWDGWGQPDGLTGEAIPLGARVIAAADTYEAMIASRPYREAFTTSQAAEELRRCRGTQLDPRVVDVLLDILGHASPDHGARHAEPVPPLASVRGPHSAVHI